ncbi:rCG33709 [Rattus norvegicus]|uniref:RCG33709 n=1 Tax=Rattus norvegicus TaxID=10116 RepID=A6HHZ0_RAT|nr:rCG33709 [Rattus norvegicus]
MCSVLQVPSSVSCHPCLGGSHTVELANYQAGLKLKIHLSLLPKCWD